MDRVLRGARVDGDGIKLLHGRTISLQCNDGARAKAQKPPPNLFPSQETPRVALVPRHIDSAFGMCAISGRYFRTLFPDAVVSRSKPTIRGRKTERNNLSHRLQSHYFGLSLSDILPLLFKTWSCLTNILAERSLSATIGVGLLYNFLFCVLPMFLHLPRHTTKTMLIFGGLTSPLDGCLLSGPRPPIIPVMLHPTP